MSRMLAVLKESISAAQYERLCRSDVSAIETMYRKVVGQ